MGQVWRGLFWGVGPSIHACNVNVDCITRSSLSPAFDRPTTAQFPPLEAPKHSRQTGHTFGFLENCLISRVTIGSYGMLFYLRATSITFINIQQMVKLLGVTSHSTCSLEFISHSPSINGCVLAPSQALLCSFSSGCGIQGAHLAVIQLTTRAGQGETTSHSGCSCSGKNAKAISREYHT